MPTSAAHDHQHSVSCCFADGASRQVKIGLHQFDRVKINVITTVSRHTQDFQLIFQQDSAQATERTLILACKFANFIDLKSFSSAHYAVNLYCESLEIPPHLRCVTTLRCDLWLITASVKLNSSWDGRPFGNNRRGPKSGGCCAPFLGRALDPHLIQRRLDRGLPPHQVPSWMIHPTVWHLA